MIYLTLYGKLKLITTFLKDYNFDFTADEESKREIALDIIAQEHYNDITTIDELKNYLYFDSNVELYVLNLINLGLTPVQIMQLDDDIIYQVKDAINEFYILEDSLADGFICDYNGELDKFIRDNNYNIEKLMELIISTLKYYNIKSEYIPLEKFIEIFNNESYQFNGKN